MDKIDWFDFRWAILALINWIGAVSVTVFWAVDNSALFFEAVYYTWFGMLAVLIGLLLFFIEVTTIRFD